MTPLRILLTNDDGIAAPGLAVLRAALADIGEVFTVAPERPRSAIGHAVTLHKPLRLAEVTLEDGADAWSSNGTPTDCVSLAYDVVMEGRADLAFAGINDGANLGWDITYSGTVMAAMEAAILGVPAIAVSVAVDERPASHYAPAAAFSVALARKVIAHGLPRHSLLNVNVPDLPEGELRGVAVTSQGRREYIDRIAVRNDPRDKPYYWLAGALKDGRGDEGSDIRAVRDGYVSVTPIEIDMTAEAVLPKLREWWPAASSLGSRGPR
jgi:5'-nucleotidase